MAVRAHASYSRARLSPCHVIADRLLSVIGRETYLSPYRNVTAPTERENALEYQTESSAVGSPTLLLQTLNVRERIPGSKASVVGSVTCYRFEKAPPDTRTATPFPADAPACGVREIIRTHIYPWVAP